MASVLLLHLWGPVVPWQGRPVGCVLLLQVGVAGTVPSPMGLRFLRGRTSSPVPDDPDLGGFFHQRDFVSHQSPSCYSHLCLAWVKRISDEMMDKDAGTQSPDVSTRMLATCHNADSSQNENLWDLLRKVFPFGTSLVTPRLVLCASSAAGTGSIPGWGTRIPHAVWHSPPPQNYFSFFLFTLWGQSQSVIKSLW